MSMSPEATLSHGQGWRKELKSGSHRGLTGLFYMAKPNSCEGKKVGGLWPLAPPQFFTFHGVTIQDDTANHAGHSSCMPCTGSLWVQAECQHVATFTMLD